jgi:hypothetical protein
MWLKAALSYVTFTLCSNACLRGTHDVRRDSRPCVYAHVLVRGCHGAYTQVPYVRKTCVYAPQGAYTVGTYTQAGVGIRALGIRSDYTT